MTFVRPDNSIIDRGSWVLDQIFFKLVYDGICIDISYGRVILLAYAKFSKSLKMQNLSLRMPWVINKNYKTTSNTLLQCNTHFFNTVFYLIQLQFNMHWKLYNPFEPTRVNTVEVPRPRAKAKNWKKQESQFHATLLHFIRGYDFLNCPL